MGGVGGLGVWGAQCQNNNTAGVSSKTADVPVACQAARALLRPNSEERRAAAARAG